MTKILNYITRLGFENVEAAVENAHRTGKKHDQRPKHIIAKLCSRPFKRGLLEASKSADGKAVLSEVRLCRGFHT